MKRGIFVTATGTDIGKTYVSGLLVKQLRENGVACEYYKPVLSGAVREGDRIIAGDAQHVTDIAKLGGNALNRVTYLFEPAVSPHLASKMSGEKIELEKILSDYNNYKTFTLVEGAGGIICPLDLDTPLFMYDLPKTLNLSCIVVADGGLGTINYTYLTVDFMKRSGLNVIGIILNNYDPTNTMHLDNKEVVEDLCKVKVLGTVTKNANKIDFIPNGLEAIYE